MRYDVGQKVIFEGELCLVHTADASDQTYIVIPVDGDIGDWSWQAEKDLTPAEEPKTVVGVVQDAATAVRDRIKGWRMYYDNSSARRKEQPVAEGFLDYFPAAARLVAELSRLGNEKHNPGQPMHWARGKSMDHRDCVARHIMDADEIDDETQLAEAVSAVWRACAYLQVLAEEKYGWPKAPRAR